MSELKNVSQCNFTVCNLDGRIVERPDVMIFQVEFPRNLTNDWIKTIKRHTLQYVERQCNVSLIQYAESDEWEHKEENKLYVGDYFSGMFTVFVIDQNIEEFDDE